MCVVTFIDSWHFSEETRMKAKSSRDKYVDVGLFARHRRTHYHERLYLI